MKDVYLKVRMTNDDYLKFKDTCENKGKTMSKVLRSFINSYCDADNLVLLDMDDKTLNDTYSTCKEKQIKFKDLVKFLLKKANLNKGKFDFK